MDILSKMFLNYALWTFKKQFTERKSSRSKNFTVHRLSFLVVLIPLVPDALPFKCILHSGRPPT